MPELPDLAVMANNLNKQLQNHIVQSVYLHVDRKANATKSELENALSHRKIKSIYREGKELRLEIGDQLLGLHLMLHGELKLVATDEEVKSPILQLDFPTQSLYLTDWQKAATPTLNPEKSHVPDALAIKEGFLKDFLSRKKIDVKAFLLDQKIIRGIGNAYADEILYDAGISPFSIANRLPIKAVKQLLKSIDSVINNAIDNISKADPQWVTGEERDFMKIHLPKATLTTKGEEILIAQKGSRKTYYTENQTLYT